MPGGRVQVVRFSPDGKWVVSGDEAGEIRLWDVTAGKMLQRFTLHEGAVTGLHFHPSEYLLGSSSADRTVRLWDLETMSQAEFLGPEATGVSWSGHVIGPMWWAGHHPFLRVIHMPRARPFRRRSAASCSPRMVAA